MEGACGLESKASFSAWEQTASNKPERTLFSSEAWKYVPVRRQKPVVVMGKKLKEMQLLAWEGFRAREVPPTISVSCGIK